LIHGVSPCFTNDPSASNELIASLKKELASQTTVGQQSRSLQRKLRDRESEVAGLQTKADDLSSQLSTAHTEIKALQTKLAAARNATVTTESVGAKGPGSAVKGGANRIAATGAAEAAQVAQLAQLKEDLYSDLTGLIIRGVKKRDADHLYDCIQTGTNGSESYLLNNLA
jgi:chromosome segregation ATPase